MSRKTLKYPKIWKLNGFKIHIKRDDSELIIKDEYGNVMKISKKDHLFILLNLEGNFKPD